jgi:glycosyltransferase involved in cell wall biosynthesis
MMSSEPLVSIITPSLNQARYIEEAIQSVLEQSYRNIEYIIVDGGSVDETLNIVRKYNHDPRLSWSSESDLGQYDAVNKGFLRAQGKIVGWINADDRYEKNAVESIVHTFNVLPDIDLIYGRLRGCFDDQGHERDLYCRNFSIKWLRRYCYTNPSATFLKADIIRREGYTLDLSVPTYGDWDWFLRLAKAGKKFHYYPHVVGFFRIHRESRIMTMNRHQQQAERILIARRHDISTRYITLWTDYIIPWYERIVNMGMLVKKRAWGTFIKRVITSYRYLRKGTV